MGNEFYFEYEAEDKSAFEVPEAGGGYAALIECDAELLKEWGLWKSFVKEYRDDRQTLQEWFETTTPGEMDESFSGEPPSDEEMEDYSELWGPTAPFDPAEAKDWANKWIVLLDLMSDEEAKLVFPLADHLHHREKPFGPDYEIKELRRVVAQADCAISHNIEMTMHMVIG